MILTGSKEAQDDRHDGACREESLPPFQGCSLLTREWRLLSILTEPVVRTHGKKLKKKLSLPLTSVLQGRLVLDGMGLSSDADCIGMWRRRADAAQGTKCLKDD